MQKKKKVHFQIFAPSPHVRSVIFALFRFLSLCRLLFDISVRLISVIVCHVLLELQVIRRGERKEEEGSEQETIDFSFSLSLTEILLKRATV